MIRTDRVMLSMLATCTFILIFHFVSYLVPVSWVVKYYDVYPTTNVVQADEFVKIGMVSKMEVLWPAMLEFNDIVRCNDAILGGKSTRWNYHDDQSSKNTSVLPSDGIYEQPWDLYTFFKTPHKKCYVESNTTVIWRVGPFRREEVITFNESVDDVEARHIFEVVE